MGLSISAEHARNYWVVRQGLGKSPSGGVADLVHATGWLNSPGSTAPYLAIRARRPECDKAGVDRAVFNGAGLVEIPAVRGCTMLVPAEDVSLALFAARRSREDVQNRIRSACGITKREVEELTRAVVNLLERGPLGQDEIRSRIPARLNRGLGQEGKRFGENSMLTFVLRHLQLQGIVLRFATDSKLDSGAYSFMLAPWKQGEEFAAAEAWQQLASRFFEWAAPATLKEFAWWAGISQKEAREALLALKMIKVSVSEWTEEAWVPAEQADALAGMRSTRNGGAIRFLPFRDNYLYFRRNLAVFVEPEERQCKVIDWMNRLVPIGELQSLHSNAIAIDGRLSGLWEYDPENRKVVWSVIGAMKTDQRRALEALVEELEKFIRSELGDVSFYAFDAGPKRRMRINSLR
jgi:hypothetical protein